MITKFQVMTPGHYGVSLNTTVSEPAFILVRFTSFWLTSEA